MQIRQAGRLPGWGDLALVFGLFAAALDAKEIAVSLPVAIALYELLWHPPAGWKPRELWRWSRYEGRFAAIGGLADIAYFVGKRYGANSPWQYAAYRTRYSAAAYFQSLSHYLGQLIRRPATISTWQVIGLLAATLALAAITRRRCLLWGVGFIAVGVLPLAFIPERGGFAYLVRSVGCAVYAGGFLDWLVESLAGKRVWSRGAAQALLFAALLVVLAPWQRKWIEMQAKAAHETQGRYRRHIEQIHALIPASRKGAHILLLSDADGQDDYDVVLAMRLYYGDPHMEVPRMTAWRAQHIQTDRRGYDYVLDWVDGRFVLAGYK